MEITPLTEVDPADPRDQDRNREPSPWLATNTGQLLRAYGLTEEQARPTLLAAGPLGPRRVGELVGITFPSGATGLWLTTYGSDNPDTGDNSVTGIQLPFGPAGTDLLDRVVAVRTDGGLVVSAPSGVRADVLDAAGSVVDTVPLREGGGTGPLTDSTGTSVRILDAGRRRRRRGPDRGRRVSTEPASVTAMRQLVAEARLRRPSLQARVARRYSRPPTTASTAPRNS